MKKDVKYLGAKTDTNYALQAEGHRFEPGSSHPEGLTEKVEPSFSFRSFRLNSLILQML